jgi:hypothetical protein
MRGRIRTASRTRPFVTAAAVAFSLGLFIMLEADSGTALEASVGVATPELKVLGVGYRYSKRYRPLYLDRSFASDNSHRPYSNMPYGGSDEIRELQRLHPETLWPPSMRYFPYP